jgi:hypothetical protein
MVTSNSEKVNLFTLILMNGIYARSPALAAPAASRKQFVKIAGRLLSGPHNSA